MCGTSEIRIRSSPTVGPKRNRSTSGVYGDDLEDATGNGSSSSSSSEASSSSPYKSVRKSLHFAHVSNDDSGDDLFVENGGKYIDNDSAHRHLHHDETSAAGRSVTFSPNNQTFVIPTRRRRRGGNRNRKGQKNKTNIFLGLDRRALLVLAQMACTVVVLAVVGYYRGSGTSLRGVIVPGGLEQRYQRIRSVMAQRSRRLAVANDRSDLTKSSVAGQYPSSIRIFTLPDTLRLDLEKELLRPEVSVDVTDLQSLEAFIVQVKDIVGSHISSWDPSVLETLQSLAEPSARGDTAAVLFRNLPLDPYVPPTPTDGSTTLHKPTFVAEALLLAIGELSGTSVVGYASETQYSNPWVHEGFPYPQQQDVGGGSSTNDGRTGTITGSALTMPTGMAHHQDMSYHLHPPDLLGLYCLREGHDKSLQTTVILNQDVVDRLPSDALQVLMADRFQVHTSAWVDGFDARHEGRPIISSMDPPKVTTANNDAGDDSLDLSIALPVDWTNMVGLDEEASAALQALGVAMNAAPQYPVHFVEGDMLLFNNRRVVHARSDYTDLRLDGGDRVVDRAYFRREWPSEEARRTRMI